MKTNTLYKHIVAGVAPAAPILTATSAHSLRLEPAIHDWRHWNVANVCNGGHITVNNHINYNNKPAAENDDGIQGEELFKKTEEEE